MKFFYILLSVAVSISVACIFIQKTRELAFFIIHMQCKLVNGGLSYILHSGEMRNHSPCFNINRACFKGGQDIHFMGAFTDVIRPEVVPVSFWQIQSSSVNALF